MYWSIQSYKQTIYELQLFNTRFDKKAALFVADVFIPVSLKCNEQFWNLLGLLPGVCHGQLKTAPLACKKQLFLNHMRIMNRRMVFMELDYPIKIQRLPIALLHPSRCADIEDNLRALLFSEVLQPLDQRPSAKYSSTDCSTTLSF